jgi:hypothetical protein
MNVDSLKDYEIHTLRFAGWINQKEHLGALGVLGGL